MELSWLYAFGLQAVSVLVLVYVLALLATSSFRQPSIRSSGKHDNPHP